MIIYIYISYQNGMYIWLQFTAPSSVHCFHEESILSGIVAYVTARIYLLIYKITDRIYIILNTHSILFMYVHIYACMYTFSSEEN